MEDRTGVIRLGRDGAAPDCDAPLSSLPEQNRHVLFEDPAIGMKVGTWSSTGIRQTFQAYPQDAFMHVLEGCVSMLDGDGNATPVEKGQSFCLPRSIPVRWEQQGLLHTFFVTLSPPGVTDSQDVSQRGSAIVLDADALEPGLVAEQNAIGGGKQRDNLVFTNRTGNMTVGMWETSAFESAMQPFSIHEVAQIISGEITILEEDGTEHVFGPGDVAFVPRGTVCSWRSKGTARKFYAIVDPKVTPHTGSQ